MGPSTGLPRGCIGRYQALSTLSTITAKMGPLSHGWETMRSTPPLESGAGHNIDTTLRTLGWFHQAILTNRGRFPSGSSLGDFGGGVRRPCAPRRMPTIPTIWTATCPVQDAGFSSIRASRSTPRRDTPRASHLMRSLQLHPLRCERLSDDDDFGEMGRRVQAPTGEPPVSWDPLSRAS